MSAPSRRGALLGLALLAVAVVIAWLLRGESGAEAPAKRDDGAAAVVPGELPTFAAPVEAEDAAVAPLAVDEGEGAVAASAAATGRLIVRVLWASDRAAAPGVGLQLVSWDAPDPLFSQRDGVTDNDGRWDVPDAPLGRASVYVDRANGDNVEIRAGQTTELLLEIPAGIFVRGLVMDADERAVAGADIWMRMGHAGQGRIVAQSGADGRFTLRDVDERRDLGALAAGHIPSPLIAVSDDGSHVCDVTLRLGGPGAQLAGRVLDVQGAPVPGTLLVIGPEEGWPPPDAGNRVRVSGIPPRRATTDAQGAFALRDLPPRRTPVAARVRGHSPWSGYVDLQVGDNMPLEIVLQESAVVSGMVSDGSGRPVAKATVSTGGYSDMDWVSADSGADGRYELADVPLGLRELRASLKGTGKDATEMAVVAGARLEWNPRLTLGLQIFGRVVDAAGAPVVGHHVDGDAYQPGRTIRAQCDTDLQGRFTLNNCADAEHTLSVRTPDWMTVVATQQHVRPGPDEVLLVTLSDTRRSAWLIGRLLDSHGQVPEMATVGASDPLKGYGESKSIAADTGEFRLGPLLPGEWEVYVMVAGRHSQKRGRFTLVADQTLDVGTLVVGESGRIVVHIALPPGAEPANLIGGVMATDKSGGSMLTRVDGEPSTWTSEPLAEGDYDVTISGGSGGAETVFIIGLQATAHVAPGADTHLEFVAERGTAQGIDLHTEREQPPKTTVLVFGPDGSEVLNRDIDWYDMDRDGRDDDGHAGFRGRPGAYTLRVTSDGRVIEERTFSLPGDVNIAPLIVVSVP